MTAIVCLPGTSLANERGEAVAPVKVLRSEALLVRGEGYGLPHGSRSVRALQLRLRTLGFEPGPIDGLFGPLTQGAVLRFQQTHGLVVDGIVGPQTRKPLVAQPAAGQRDQRDANRPAAKSNRPEPANRAEPANRPEPGRGEPHADAAPRDPVGAIDLPSAPAPDPAVRPATAPTSGLSPWIAAALGALGAGLILGALRLRASRRGGGSGGGAHVAPPGAADRRPSLGMVFAALLAVFAVGAAVGALFAANAAEDGRATADEPQAALGPP